jgi:hypothetical protein
MTETDRAARVARLSAAAAARRADAETRARRAIIKLANAGEHVTFVTVARVGGVSTSFLYQHDQLRADIETRRSSKQPMHRPAAETASAASLRTKLQVAVQRNRQLTDELTALRLENEALRSQVLQRQHQAAAFTSERPATDG